MSFSADPSGTFGTLLINGIGQLQVYNDGTLKNPSGKVIGTSQGILGTVSQSGGIPTGAVIESDSNANGEYIKFADGTLICSGSISVVGTGWITSLDIKYSANALWTFPAVSTINMITSLGVKDASVAARSAWCPYCISSTTGATVYLACLSTSTSTSNISVDLLSIGRWF